MDKTVWLHECDVKNWQILTFLHKHLKKKGASLSVPSLPFDSWFNWLHDLYMCLCHGYNKKPWFFGARAEHCEDTVLGMCEGALLRPSTARTSLRGLGPCSHSPPTVPVQLFQPPARPSEWHFKVSPVAVTSARRNVTGCFVSRHWLYPMCYHQHPPERNKNHPSEGFPRPFGPLIDALNIRFTVI